MTTPISLEAQRFWNAAIFMRRAPHRDQSVAIKIIDRLSRSPFEPLRTRALEMMKEQK